MGYNREKTSYLVGKRLREIRIEKGLGQENLALSAGVHPTYIGRLERGEKCPTIDTIFRIARSLDVSAAFLLDIPTGSRACDTSALNRIADAISELSANDAIAVAEIVERIVKIKKEC